MATVDDKHQIVVDAQAFGTGSESALLAPVADATLTNIEKFAGSDYAQ